MGSLQFLIVAFTGDCFKFVDKQNRTHPTLDYKNNSELDMIRVLLETSIYQSIYLLIYYKDVNQKKKRGGGVVLDLVGIRAVLSSFQPPFSKSAQRSW